MEYDYEIHYGETITISTPNDDSDDFAYIRFIPETSGNFALESKADDEIDPICMLYDAELNYLDENDDTDYLNFCMKYDFVAGEVYYFAVATYSEEAEFEVSLVCGHDYENGVCTICGDEEPCIDHYDNDEDGYCDGCDAEMICDHYDDNEDGYCDYCDDEMNSEENECDHTCHKKGISGFFWKITRFFNKLFKANQYCECGVAHY